MEKAKDFYSKNVADAIRQACAAFATSQEKLDIEVVETGSAGIFGLCRKRAHIRVSLKQAAGEGGSPGYAPQAVSPDESGETVAPASTRPVAPADTEPGKEKTGKKSSRKKSGPVHTGEAQTVEPPDEKVMAAVKDDLDKVLELMGFPSNTSVRFEQTSIQCQIDGEHEDAIIGQGGRTLDSLQYLLRKMASRDLPDRMLVDLNAGDFRERRVDELKELASELAEKVKGDGKTQAIPSLNPSERRVVHVALQEDKSIRSRSVGDGLFKKVLIYKPGSRGKKSGGRRRGRQGGGSTAEK